MRRRAGNGKSKRHCRSFGISQWRHCFKFGQYHYYYSSNSPNGTTTKTYTITVTRAATIANLPEVVSVSDPTEHPQMMGEEIMVHQGLSPNGDGVNDFLLIDGITAHPDNKLQIMNRTGQLIFEAKGYDNSTRVFDGHSNKNGAMQLPGTYFFSLDYTDQGVTKHKTGFIVLKY